MSTTIDTAGPAGALTAGSTRRPRRAAPAPIPFRRILGVELQKMFDTRAGQGLMASIVLLAVAATVATIVFSPGEELTYEAFATAIGIPIAVVLPIVAMLSVTSEWSQRTALTTFTLVPSRSRVIAAKAVLTVIIGAASMFVALAVGAAGNLIGTTIAGVDTTWDIPTDQMSRIVLGNEIGMLMGFTLGVLLRSSPAAIVGYFVYALVLPGISNALAATNQWWADHGAWFDLNWTSAQLYDNDMTAQMWAQLGVTTLIWLILPMAIGLRMLHRSEIK